VVGCHPIGELQLPAERHKGLDVGQQHPMKPAAAHLGSENVDPPQALRQAIPHGTADLSGSRASLSDIDVMVILGRSQRTLPPRL
jgi:hypothetical protein